MNLTKEGSVIMTRNRACRRARKAANAFVADQRGLGAVEFALLLPVMALLYLGSFEVAQGVAINRMVALTSSTVTNLVSQYTTISASQDMPDILNASAQILTPYSAAKATVIVSCITIDAKGKATVTWSKALNGTAKAVGSTVTVPLALATPNTVLIFGEASYAYVPLIDFLNFGTMTLYSSGYMFPRSSPTITLTS